MKFDGKIIAASHFLRDTGVINGKTISSANVTLKNMLSNPAFYKKERTLERYKYVQRALNEVTMSSAKPYINFKGTRNTKLQ